MFALVAARGLGAVAVEVIDKPAARGYRSVDYDQQSGVYSFECATRCGATN